MKNSRGVVSLRRWALFAALATACVTPSEPTAAQSQSLLGGCAKDSQCEDGNPCTQNPCALGLCAPALPVLGCCHEGACVDSDADGAVAPILELPPSGCSQHEDCEDDHPCTQKARRTRRRGVVSKATVDALSGCVFATQRGSDHPAAPRQFSSFAHPGGLCFQFGHATEAIRALEESSKFPPVKRP